MRIFKRLLVQSGLWSAIGILITSSVWAQIPPCYSGNQPLPVMDNQVVQWRNQTKNGFLARALVEGPITRIFPDKHGHNHFEIQIGRNSQDVIEVIYAFENGQLPQLRPGMIVDACGDYITAYAKSSHGDDASPSKCIIHWVHQSDNPSRHESGYVAVDGVTYGDGR